MSLNETVLNGPYQGPAPPEINPAYVPDLVFDSNRPTLIRPKGFVSEERRRENKTPCPPGWFHNKETGRCLKYRIKERGERPESIFGYRRGRPGGRVAMVDGKCPEGWYYNEGTKACRKHGVEHRTTSSRKSRKSRKSPSRKSRKSPSRKSSSCKSRSNKSSICKAYRRKRSKSPRKSRGKSRRKRSKSHRKSRRKRS